MPHLSCARVKPYQRGQHSLLGVPLCETAPMELHEAVRRRAMVRSYAADAVDPAVVDRIVAAAEDMRRDGWWWSAPELTDKSIRRRLLKEMLQARFSSASAPISPIGSISSPRIK